MGVVAGEMMYEAHEEASSRMTEGCGEADSVVARRKFRIFDLYLL